MTKTKLATLIAVGLILGPIQAFAQGAGGSPLPPRPGDPSVASGGVGGSAAPSKPGSRFSTSSGGVGGSAPPPRPGAPNGGIPGN